MKRFVEAALKLAPLVRQAWPILAAIAAILADAFGATGGAATGAAVGLLAAGQVAGAGRRLAAVDALAEPLRPIADVAERPVFEVHPDRGRLRVVSVSLHGRKHDLVNGPPMFIDATADGPGVGDYGDESDWDCDVDDDDPSVATIPPGVD